MEDEAVVFHIKAAGSYIVIREIELEQEVNDGLRCGGFHWRGSGFCSARVERRGEANEGSEQGGGRFHVTPN